MKRTKITAVVLAVAAVAIAAIAFVLFRSDGEPSATDPTESTTGPGATADSVPQVPLKTLPAGEVAPMGTAIVPQDLPETCDSAVAPIRELMETFESGRDLDAAGADKLNAAIGAANQNCSAEDWQRFHDKEFLGWFMPAPK